MASVYMKTVRSLPADISVAMDNGVVLGILWAKEMKLSAPPKQSLLPKQSSLRLFSAD